MPVSLDKQKEMFKYIRKKKIVTHHEIQNAFGYEVNSFIRIMKGHGYYSSCNKNGKYYTLAEIPKFDENGLWEFKKVRFSKNGTLKDTIMNMVNTSETGIASQDAIALHGSSGRVVLCKLFRDKAVNRKMIEGTFVYTAKDSEKSSQQLQERLNRLNQHNISIRLPSQDIVIGILVLFLKRPKWSAKQVANNLKRQGISVERADVMAVINYFDLPLKKTVESTL